MRADRLLSLLMLLQTRGRMTAQELADRLEVSTRTIYRDLDALSGAGVPVYAERGPQGGVSLLENYRTNLTGLKENEVRALFMLTVPGLLSDLGAGDAAEQALLKLTAALPPPFQADAERVRQRVLLDPAAWFAPPEPAPFLPLVQTAVFQQQRLRVTYRRGDGQWVKRLLDPYGLVAKASVWYVVAGSYGRPATFRVSRIQEAALTDSRFERPSDFDLAAFWQAWRVGLEASLSRYPVTVRVAPAGLPLLVQAFGEGMHAHIAAAGEPDAAGGVTLSLAFDGEDTACRQLLGLGTAVTIVDPPALRQRLAEAARSLAAHHARID